MSSRKCRKNNEAFYYVIAPAILMVGLAFEQARAAGIDSIRAMPVALPAAETGVRDTPIGFCLEREGEAPAEPRMTTKHRLSGSFALPVKHRLSGSFALPVKHRLSGSFALPVKPSLALRVGKEQFAPSHLIELEPCLVDTGEPWTWQVLPRGLIFRSYLAGGREPRFGSQWVHLKGRDWVWDATIGGRLGLLRYGTRNPLAPQGWELDIEGAAFPRLTLDSRRDMISSDFRFGIPLTHRRGRWESKFAVYHLSSHLADEYILIHPERERINFSRDVLTFAVGYFPREDVRLYAECGWAWYADGGSEPWEFQFGIEYSPLYPNGIDGTPFFAINTRLREEVDYGGNMTVQAGWQWRGWSGQRLRVGMQYFNGMSDQYQFFREFEEQIGFGAWYDF